jgi:hypothetical protein
MIVRAAAAAAAAAAALALLACGSSGGPARAARAESSGRAQEAEAETRFQDFARCLREHGIQAEALSRPGGGHGLKVRGASPAAMGAAEKACARYRPKDQSGPSHFSPQEKVALEERLQRFAKCMREHGIKVETSAAGGRAQIQIHPGGAGGGPNPESPAFLAAQKTCSPLLPGGGPTNGNPPSGG